MKRPRQLELALSARPTWGGRRKGAGRRPGPHPRVRHRSRASLAARFPCHVTMRVRTDVPSLRTVKFVREFERSLARSRERGHFRVVHYSLQSNHAHFVVEARDRAALGRGMKSLGARLSRAVNRVFARRGSVLADRYHVRIARTPLEVRRTLAYVLLNSRRHARRPAPGAKTATRFDPASSARWFDGWRWVGPDTSLTGPPAPVAAARTWLLRRGWRRHGLIEPSEVPGRGV